MTSNRLCTEPRALTISMVCMETKHKAKHWDRILRAAMPMVRSITSNRVCEQSSQCWSDTSPCCGGWHYWALTIGRYQAFPDQGPRRAQQSEISKASIYAEVSTTHNRFRRTTQCSYSEKKQLVRQAQIAELIPGTEMCTTWRMVPSSDSISPASHLGVQPLGHSTALLQLRLADAQPFFQFFIRGFEVRHFTLRFFEIALEQLLLMLQVKKPFLQQGHLLVLVHYHSELPFCFFLRCFQVHLHTRANKWCEIFHRFA